MRLFDSGWVEFRTKCYNQQRARRLNPRSANASRLVGSVKRASSKIIETGVAPKTLSDSTLAKCAAWAQALPMIDSTATSLKLPRRIVVHAEYWFASAQDCNVN
jgi:hypothetical protein